MTISLVKVGVTVAAEATACSRGVRVRNRDAILPNGAGEIVKAGGAVENNGDDELSNLTKLKMPLLLE
jgi:hypothetical protein